VSWQKLYRIVYRKKFIGVGSDKNISTATVSHNR